MSSTQFVSDQFKKLVTFAPFQRLNLDRLPNPNEFIIISEAMIHDCKRYCELCFYFSRTDLYHLGFCSYPIWRFFLLLEDRTTHPRDNDINHYSLPTIRLQFRSYQFGYLAALNIRNFVACPFRKAYPCLTCKKIMFGISLLSTVKHQKPPVLSIPTKITIVQNKVNNMIIPAFNKGFKQPKLHPILEEFEIEL